MTPCPIYGPEAQFQLGVTGKLALAHMQQFPVGLGIDAGIDAIGRRQHAGSLADQHLVVAVRASCRVDGGVGLRVKDAGANKHAVRHLQRQTVTDGSHSIFDLYQLIAVQNLLDLFVTLDRKINIQPAGESYG